MRVRFIYKFIYWLVGFTTGGLLFHKISEIDNTVIEKLTTTANHYNTRTFTTRNQHLVENADTSRPSKNTSKVSKYTWPTKSTIAPEQLDEWISCDLVKQIFKQAKMSTTLIHREENEDGNKGIYFSTIKNQTGHRVSVVVKHASIQNASSESHLYRYNSALREIKTLRKLRSMNISGTSRLLGQCVNPTTITYVVTKIAGVPLCDGNGTDMECALSRKLRNSIQKLHDPSYKSLLWLKKVTCFLKQFEQHRMFLEDVSGINFYYSLKTMDVYLVDPDSIIFYDDVRLDSRSSCRANSDCPRPKGNQWRFHALNHKIYYSCQESTGYCYKNLCRGYDSSFHACGIARWLLLPLQNTAPDFLRRDYKRLVDCMMEQYPEKRCTLKDSCDEAEKILQKLLEARASAKNHMHDKYRSN